MILKKDLTGRDVLLSASEPDLFRRLVGRKSGACRNQKKHDSHDSTSAERLRNKCHYDRKCSGWVILKAHSFSSGCLVLPLDLVIIDSLTKWTILELPRETDEVANYRFKNDSALLLGG